MTNVISALSARTQVDRRSQPTVKDYVNTLAPPPQRLRDIQTASKRRGTQSLTMRQINAQSARLHRRPKKSS
jgi:hypothetical protein